MDVSGETIVPHRYRVAPAQISIPYGYQSVNLEPAFCLLQLFLTHILSALTQQQRRREMLTQSPSNIQVMRT